MEARRRRPSRQQGGEDEAAQPEHVEGGSNRIRLVIVLIVIVIVAVVSAAVYFAPSSASGIDITLNSGKVTEMNSAALGLQVVFTVHNRTAKNVTYYGSDYNLSENGNFITTGYLRDNTRLTPGETRVLNESILVDLGDTISLSNQNSQGLWRIQGTATLGMPNGNQSQGYDFNFSTQ